ncbi:hypothetical protein [Antarcticirhabdus aurantiaca]|uniref:hypothetical protein n=1 Tax=Antarcticirhabdus aurantiaca TaxID=2606717 RepID=UPI00131B0C03|nr:hypothetical protein [Antarcticirhabdus aurantiaca]
MRMPRLTACASILSLAGCVAPSTGLPPPTPPIDPDLAGISLTLSSAEIQVVEEGVRRSMKDPMSAMFDGIRGAINDRDSASACGLVNGRNSFGGYTGDKIFVGVFNQQRTVFAPSAIAVTPNDAVAIYTLCRHIGAVP